MGWFESFVRSRWWLVGTMIVPSILIGCGAIHLAYKLSAQQIEIGQLQAELRTCRSQIQPNIEDPSQGGSTVSDADVDARNACAFSLGYEVQSEHVSVDDDHGVEIQLNGVSGRWFSWSISPDEADALGLLLNQVANQKRKQVNKQGPLL
jgi:hypothetical protein